MGCICSRGDHPPDYESLLGGFGAEAALLQFRNFHRKHFNLNLIQVLEEFYERRDKQNLLGVQEEFSAALMHLLYTDDLFQKHLKGQKTFVFPGEWNAKFTEEAPILYQLAQDVLLHVKGG